MVESFADIQYSKNRKIVIHQAYNPLISDSIHKDDVLFFDDCLYSQYKFVVDNYDDLMLKNVKCVFGFSSALFRDDCVSPIAKIESYKIHDKVNSYVKTYHDIDNRSNDFSGLMTIAEIKQLMELDNIRFALHGCCHLNLKLIQSKLSQMTAFISDLDDGIQLWRQHFNDYPKAYVFPYAYEPFLANRALIKRNIHYSFAGMHSKRIPIEDVMIGDI